jgi:hypothetical protein
MEVHMLTPRLIINKFGLKPLPGEGGFYVQTYRSAETIPKSVLPSRYDSDKAIGTAIYYLITPDSFSALHRLPTDEIFHFYFGDPVIMLNLFEHGDSKVITLGNKIMEGQNVQVVVPKRTWQGSFLANDGRFAFLGTTMAPGFDFSDYEGGTRDELIIQYPDRADLITRLTSVQ